MQDKRVLPQVDQDICSLCGLCAEACGCGAVRIGEEGPVFDCPESGSAESTGCACLCEEVCPSGAIEVGFEIVEQSEPSEPTEGEQEDR